MAHKEFHLRANEVRAESRALMLKLRTERLANSRHTSKAVAENAAGVALKIPVTTVKTTSSVSSARPKATVKTPPVSIKPVSNIIVSRKVNAAVVPADAILPVEETAVAIQEPVADVVVEAKPEAALIISQPAHSVVAIKPKTVRKSKAIKAHEATMVAALPKAAPVTPAPDAKVVQKKSPKPALAAMLVEAGVLIETDMLQVAEQHVVNPEEPAITTVAIKSKINKPQRILKPVLDISAQRLGTVEELMEAVAASVRTPSARIEKPAVLSGRALVPVSTVPSLGPGMIWRLNQVGVNTLADLASIEPDDLRAKLGPVAKLVRVENWIAFARAA